MIDVTSFDTETELIDAGLLAPPLVCLSTCDKQLKPELFHWADALPVFRELLKGNCVGQNVSYDLGVLAAQFPEVLPEIFDALFDSRIVDTRLNERLIDIARGQLDGWKDHHGIYHRRTYSLSALSERYGFGAMEKDAWRLRYGELRSLPLTEWPTGALEYAKTDALRTLQVLYQQLNYLEFLEDAAAQTRAAFALHLQSCRGIITDARACDEFIDATKAELERCKKLLQNKQLVDLAGKRKLKLARQYMTDVCRERGLEVPMTEPGKDAKDSWTPSVCVDAEACRDTGDDVLVAYATYTSANTVLKKAELLKQGSEGIPLQTAYESLLETGRTSSRAPMPPMVGQNFQNLPRDSKMRQVFVPRPGYVLCSVDYSMAELRTFAQICIWVLGYSKLGEALNAGKDVHCILAAAMMHKDYEWVMANKRDPEVKRMRSIAKSANFGKLGGLGVKAFIAYCSANRLRVSEEDAIKVDVAFRSTWTEINPYFAWIKEMMQDGKATYKSFVTSRVRACLSFTQAANNGFQSLAADAAKSALLPVAFESYVDTSSPLYGSRPLLFIHDEVLAELPEANAHAAAYRLRDLMVEHFNHFVPDVPVTAEPAIARRWFKEMEPVHDIKGQLQCWEEAA